MTTGIGVVRRDTHQTMHAAFGLQPAIGIVAGDLDGRRFDAGFFTLRLFEILDLETVLFSPARIHAQQHRGPVLALGAAGAGMDFEIGVEAIGLARQQRLQLAARHLFFSALSAFSASVTTLWSPSASPSSIISTLSSSSRVDLADALEASPPARCAPASGAGPFWGSFQRLGSSARAFSSASRAVDASTSKMPPQQPD